MNRLGEEGKVEQSQALMQRVELMKRQQQDILNPRPGPGEKVYVVCVQRSTDMHNSL